MYLTKKRNRIATILLANLMSSGAAVLINISIAAHIQITTGSSASAALAIVFAYLPPLFLSAYIGEIIDAKLNRKWIILIETLSSLMTITCGFVIYYDAPLVVVLGSLGIRSISIAASRNSLMRWLKLISLPNKQESNMQYFILTILLSLPLSGIAMRLASYSSESGNWVFIAITMMLHILAIIFLLILPKLPDLEEKNQTLRCSKRVIGIWATVLEILNNKSIGPFFLACIFTQPVFQAAEQVLVATKGPSLSGTAELQTVGGIGLFLGLVVLLCVRKFIGVNNLILVVLILLGIISLVVTASSNELSIAIYSFMIMTFAYEMLDTYFFSRYFKLIPASRVARYSITVNAVGGTLMSMSSLALGLLFDTLGFELGAIFFAVLSIAYGLILLVIYRYFVIKFFSYEPII